LKNSKIYSNIHQFFSFLLGCGFSCFQLSSTVKIEGWVMISNLSDELLVKKFSKCSSSYWSIDFELVAHNWYGQWLDSRSFFANSFPAFLIDEDGIVKLFLYLYLGPTLLFSLASLSVFSIFTAGLSFMVSLLLVSLSLCLCLLEKKVNDKIKMGTISLIWVLLIK
jgi:hypothetical protein